MTYLVTFYSQFDSNQFYRNFSKLGKVVRKPVPRELSSSCGTCCTFEPNSCTFGPGNGMGDITELFNEAEFEKVYLMTEPQARKKETQISKEGHQAGGTKHQLEKLSYTLLLEKE